MRTGLMLPFLFALMFFHVGETNEQWDSFGIGNIIDWTTDRIIRDYVQEFITKCGFSAVRAALYEACADLEIASCRSVAKNIHDSYTGVSYYCSRLGSMAYHAAKGVGKLAVQVAWHGTRTTAYLIGYTLYYTGYALTSGAQYMLE